MVDSRQTDKTKDQPDVGDPSSAPISVSPASVFSEADRARLRAAFECELPCLTREVDGDPAFSFTLGAKTVEFRWPRHAPEEIWVALFGSPEGYQTRLAELVMFEEASTEEGRDWMLGFMERLGWRYLRSPTRIGRGGKFLGPKRLECFDGVEWKDIYTEFD